MTTENLADRKAHAAKLFDALAPLVRQTQILEIARTYADENGLPYPPTIVDGITEIREMLRRAGLPQAEIDGLPGLAPLGTGRAL
jgi:type VI protein secretion system component VasF